ncbi:MAG: FxsA family protein [Casimicrobium sp.]
MPILFLAILIGLPILDIYATLRFAEALGVPGIALFVPGLIFGVMIMKREARTLKSRFAGAVQSLSLNAMVFDSGRRMLAALLFLMPGFVSDVVALFLILIPNRSLAMPGVGGNTVGGFSRSEARDAPRSPNASTGARDASVVDGEYRRVD